MAVIKGLHAFIIKEQFRKSLQAKGYAFFGLENKAAYNVNIIGVRSDRISLISSMMRLLLSIVTGNKTGRFAPILSPQIQARSGKKNR